MYKKILVSLILFTPLQIQAINLSTPTTATSNSYICDSDFKQSPFCNDLTDIAFITRAKLITDSKVSEKCQLNSKDTICTASFSSGSVEYIVYYATSATVEKWLITYTTNLLGVKTYILSKPKITEKEQENALLVRKANESKIAIRKAFTFTESENGIFYNENGQTPSELSKF